jgi:hypothetical protein
MIQLLLGSINDTLVKVYIYTVLGPLPVLITVGGLAVAIVTGIELSNG